MEVTPKGHHHYSVFLLVHLEDHLTEIYRANLCNLIGNIVAGTLNHPYPLVSDKRCDSLSTCDPYLRSTRVQVFNYSG